MHVVIVVYSQSERRLQKSQHKIMIAIGKEMGPKQLETRDNLIYV